MIPLRYYHPCAQNDCEKLQRYPKNQKNTIFTIIIVVGLGLLIGLVIHQENILTERGNIAFFKRQKK